MRNIHFEEKNFNDMIKKSHNEEVEKFNLPEWINFDCPYCKSKLNKRAIREIGIKLNSRNIGDVVIEFCCDSCSVMNTLYYKSETNTISDFVKLLLGEKTPNSTPILEEEMYKSKYNNLIEKIGIK